MDDYENHISHMPPDDNAESFAWAKPAIARIRPICSEEYKGSSISWNPSIFQDASHDVVDEQSVETSPRSGFGG
jgi:hypothetical protein